MNDFLNEQRVVCTVLKNAVQKGQCSHAYLFETNGYEKKNAFVFAFVKYLLCPNHQENQASCVSCHQCELIEKGIYPDVKIIEPDGLWIKKEQLEELQEEFSRTSSQNNRRIYIIKNAEKLNVSASNSILKFLEEPEPNIMAILMTDNLYQMLDTIVSRCQIISFSKSNQLYRKSFSEKLRVLLSLNVEDLEIQTLEDRLMRACNFINYYEANGKETLLHTQKLWHIYFKDRETNMLALDFVVLYYKDIINYKLNLSLLLFDDYQEEMKKIAAHNTLSQLCQKLKLVLELKEENKVNVNNNLLLDKLILSLEEVL